MIFFDVTKVSRQDHHSGLVRVSRCLRAALRAEGGEDGVVDVVWHARRRTFVAADRRAPIAPASGDWLLTPELFSEEERPGLTAWLQARPCRAAAVYHDAIPLQHPEFTWPQSVARHPYYLKLLGAFDQVIANSAASARELEDYWRWLGVAAPSPIPVTLGADGNGRARAAFDPQRSTRRSVVMIGILEPRKIRRLCSTPRNNCGPKVWSSICISSAG